MQQLDHSQRLMLRTEETAQLYADSQSEKEGVGDTGCRLCNDTDVLEEYTYWRRVPNKYPYDRYFSKSDMLVIKRHTNEKGLTPEERAEFIELKGGALTETYNHLLENLPTQSSIPHHYHVHLVTFKHPE